MWVSKLVLKNIRSFTEAELSFSRGINIIVGRNNSGKSTILKPLLGLQYPRHLSQLDLRILEDSGEIEINLFHPASYLFSFQQPVSDSPLLHVKIALPNLEKSYSFNGDGRPGPDKVTFPTKDPNNFIFPFLSKRKTVAIDEKVDEETTFSVVDNFQYLNARITRLCKSGSSRHDTFRKACQDILQFQVTTSAIGPGQIIAYMINDYTSITLDKMGEGITNLLGLIADLCIADHGKLFIIEEPENDIHPEALKSLLRLIIEKSKNNQFIITTHSNIVTKYLGAHPNSKVFNTEMSFRSDNKLPESVVREVSTTEERREILEELGYDLSDYNLWGGWLFLEESSAERIIRDYLIPWFVPKLETKLRTFSAAGIGKIKKRFTDFNYLFVFLHLERQYKNKAWVILDGGENEKKVIDDFREMYAGSGWKTEQFLQFTEHDFEKYYPEKFQHQVGQVLAIRDKSAKQSEKTLLLEKVIEWIKTDEQGAKEAFKESANEVIEILKAISTSLK